MKYIGPASFEEVSAAYMPVTEYVDSSGFNPDDPRHPRWLHPIRPDDGSDAMIDALQAAGLRVLDGADQFDTAGRLNNPGSILGVGTPGADRAICYVGRWPNKNGKYGCTIAPQYCVRDDYASLTLEEAVTCALAVKKHVEENRR